MEAQILYWTKLAAIGQIVGALATAAAVIVSLVIVLSERRESLRLVVSRKTMVPPNTAEYDVIDFEVTNVGVQRVRITAFGWRTGWAPRGPAWFRYVFGTLGHSGLAGVIDPPFDLEPGTSVSKLVLLASIADASLWRSTLFGARRVPGFGARYSPIFGTVTTARGTRKRVRVTADLRRHMMMLRDGVSSSID